MATGLISACARTFASIRRDAPKFARLPRSFRSLPIPGSFPSMVSELVTLPGQNGGQSRLARFRRRCRVRCPDIILLGMGS